MPDGRHCAGLTGTYQEDDEMTQAEGKVESRGKNMLGLLKRFAPEIAVGIVTGIISNAATGLIIRSGKGKKGKKSKKK
jgi:hypothetical protein